MSWQNRLRQMVLAGGVLVGGCGDGKLESADAAPFIGGGCGNANPDPCICGRPEASAVSAASCQAQMDCVASGGSYVPYTVTDSTGTHPPHCEMDGGSDSAGGADGGSDGNSAD
jgi:hypothetical protein